MPRLSYWMGDLYPNLGQYNDTTAQTVPLPQDVAAMDADDYDGALIKVPSNVTGNHMNSHYFGLLIICATILLLGIRL
jgi:hypothetical protein